MVEAAVHPGGFVDVLELVVVAAVVVTAVGVARIDDPMGLSLKPGSQVYDRVVVDSLCVAGRCVHDYPGETAGRPILPRGWADHDVGVESGGLQRPLQYGSRLATVECLPLVPPRQLELPQKPFWVREGI